MFQKYWRSSTNDLRGRSKAGNDPLCNNMDAISNTARMHHRDFDDDNDGHTTNNYLGIKKLQIHEEIANSETIAFFMHVLLLPQVSL